MTHPLSHLAWPRRTARLTLRPVRLGDVEAIFAYRKDEDVARWLTSLPRTPEELALKLLADDRTLVVEHDGVLVGDLMLAVQDAWSQSEVTDDAKGVQAELGWCFSPEHRGKGLATEAVTELVTIAFELGVRRVEAGCFADNTASRAVMARVGLRQEGYFVQESLHRDGTWHDGMTFALLREEWSR